MMLNFYTLYISQSILLIGKFLYTEVMDRLSVRQMIFNLTRGDDMKVPLFVMLAKTMEFFFYRM